MNEQKCPTRLISDLPAAEDAFGPHESLAAELADLIQSEQQGATVALEGGWGSGKSTVIALLDQRLKQLNNIKLTVFDAWAHQGDPLRRTFLESLIRALRPWLNQDKESAEKWDEKMRELAGRLVRTRSRETPLLEPWAKKLAFSLLLVPLGVALASMSLFADAPLSARVWILLAGICLALSPIGVLAWRYQTGKPKKGDDNVDEVDDVFAFFTNRVTTTTDTETISTPDPTSVEFERVFFEALDECLSKSDDRRVVIVLDNLDRVRPADALAIWSTMQTFIQPGDKTGAVWRKNLWVLVPYDPAGIQVLWEREERETKRSDEGQGRDTRPAESFLDKTFQIRYQVPPPLLSDWHGFLLGLLGQALPAHSEDEFHRVYRVFALTLTEDRNPTPRELKLFVNQIGSLHRLRGHDFALPLLAYYVVLQRLGKPIAEGLLRGELPSNEIIETATLTGPDARDGLAALHFGVGVARARQLLLQGPIETVIGAGDGEGLRDLADNNDEAFWVVLEATLSGTTVVFDNSVRIARAAVCLLGSGLFVDLIRPEVDSVLTALRRAVKARDSWSPLNDKTAEGLSSACQLLRSNLDFLPGLATAISATPIRSDDEKNAAQPDVWANSLLTILETLKSLEALDSIQLPIEIPATPEQWIEMSTALVERDPNGEYSSYLRTKASAKEIGTSLVGFVSGGTFSQPHRNVIELTTRLHGRAQWNELVEAIYARVNAEHALKPEEVIALLDAMCTLRDAETLAEGRLKDLGAQGYVLHHLQQMNSDDNVFAWCAFVYLRAQPGGQAPPGVGQAQSGHSALSQVLATPENRESVPKQFVRLLSQFGELPLLMTLLEQNSAARPFVAYCFHIVASTPEAVELIEPAQFVERWALIEEHLEPDDIGALVNRLVYEKGLLEHIKAQEFEPAVAGLYRSVLASADAERLTFGSWCLAGLDKLDGSAWGKALSTEGEALGLALDLQELGVLTELSLGYQDALENHATSAVGGSSSVSTYRDDWHRLPDMLPSDARTVFRRKLYEKATQAQGNVGPDCFHLYGEELGHPDVLSANPRAPLSLFEPLVAARNEPGLRWLRGIVVANLQLFTDGFDQPSVKRFKQRVRQEYVRTDDPDDDASAHIREIAKTFSMRKSLSTSEEV